LRAAGFLRNAQRGNGPMEQRSGGFFGLSGH